MRSLHAKFQLSLFKTEGGVWGDKCINDTCIKLSSRNHIKNSNFSPLNCFACSWRTIWITEGTRETLICLALPGLENLEISAPWPDLKITMVTFLHLIWGVWMRNSSSLSEESEVVKGQTTCTKIYQPATIVNFQCSNFGFSNSSGGGCCW